MDPKEFSARAEFYRKAADDHFKYAAGIPDWPDNRRSVEAFQVAWLWDKISRLNEVEALRLRASDPTP